MYSNKKKIRGWKNQIKKIEKWKNANIKLDIKNLKQIERHDVKIWIDPWYRLIRRNPPNWYCKLILKAMIEIYKSWHKSLMELNEPFYLRIWLCDPYFINSQIVVAIGDALHFYDNVFVKNTILKKFPYSKYKTADSELMNLNWELCMDDYVKFEVFDNLTDAEINKLVKKAYMVEKTICMNTEDVCYRVKIGDLWVGELAKT